MAMIGMANTGMVLEAISSGEKPSKSGRKFAVMHISLAPELSNTAIVGASNARSTNATKNKIVYLQLKLQRISLRFMPPNYIRYQGMKAVHLKGKNACG